MAELIDALTHYKKGDILTHETVNALIDAAKLAKQVLGFHDGSVEVQRYTANNKATIHLKNDTGAAILPYSVFSIADESAFTADNKDLPRGLTTAHGIDPNGSPMLFLTNGSLEIPDGAQFEPEMISFDKPTRVRAAAASTPAVGEQCGIIFDVGEMKVGSFRYGLVCLSPSWLEDGETYVWVCRTREPIKLIGCVVETIGKSSIVDNKRQLGTGRIQVLFRNPNNTLDEVTKPSAPDDKWQPLIYNYTEIEYPVGMIVGVTETTGIGLSINYETPNTLCMSSGSSYGP